jgi:head-tail adaptor
MDTAATSSMRCQRNDALFYVYYQLGPDRSLEKLRDQLTVLGLRRSLNTLKNYSSRFHWQSRVLELDARLRSEREQKALEQRDEQDERQARLGRNMQVLASAGMVSMKKLMDSGAPMAPADISSLAKTGVQIERLATGKETDRVRIIREVNNAWTLQVGAIFLSVNAIADEEGRKAEFVTLMDKFIEAQNQMVKGDE